MTIRKIDALGLKCPLPVLKAEALLQSIGPGEAFDLLANDPIARVDVVHFCRTHGHEVELSEVDGALRFRITKAGAEKPD